MRDLERSFGFYRSCFENDTRAQSIESEGIFDIHDFERIIDDTQTVSLDLPNVRVPLLVPFEKRTDWFNVDFYKKLAADNTRIIYYSHLTDIFNGDPEAYCGALESSLQSLATEHGMLIFEHSDLEASKIERDLRAILGRLGIDYEDLTAKHNTDARHYHYVSRTGLENPAVGEAGPTDFYSLFEKGLKTGILTSDTPVTVRPSIEADEIERIWEFYDSVNADLSALDPAHAGFGQDELAEVMGAREFVKLINKIGETIVNLCVIVDIRACSWMNQFYYKSNFPGEYETGRVICGVGLLTNPNIKGQLAPSLQTLGMIGKLVCLSQVEQVFTFACNTTSNVHVPALTERSLKRAGLRVDFSKPVGHQLFRALQLSSS